MLNWMKKVIGCEGEVGEGEREVVHWVSKDATKYRESGEGRKVVY